MLAYFCFNIFLYFPALRISSNVFIHSLVFVYILENTSFLFMWTCETLTVNVHPWVSMWELEEAERGHHTTWSLSLVVLIHQMWMLEPNSGPWKDQQMFLAAKPLPQSLILVLKPIRRYTCLDFCLRFMLLWQNTMTERLGEGQDYCQLRVFKSHPITMWTQSRNLK